MRNLLLATRLSNFLCICLLLKSVSTFLLVPHLPPSTAMDQFTIYQELFDGATKLASPLVGALTTPDRPPVAGRIVLIATSDSGLFKEIMSQVTDIQQGGALAVVVRGERGTLPRASVFEWILLFSRPSVKISFPAGGTIAGKLLYQMQVGTTMALTMPVFSTFANVYDPLLDLIDNGLFLGNNSLNATITVTGSQPRIPLLYLYPSANVFEFCSYSSPFDCPCRPS